MLEVNGSVCGTLNTSAVACVLHDGVVVGCSLEDAIESFEYIDNAFIATDFASLDDAVAGADSIYGILKDSVDRYVPIYWVKTGSLGDIMNGQRSDEYVEGWESVTQTEIDSLDALNDLNDGIEF